MTSQRLVLRVGLIATSTLALGACGAVTDALDPNAEPDEPESVYVMDVKEGWCIDEPSAGSDLINKVTRVPCEDPHDLEAYYSFNIDLDEMPDAETMAELADNGCISQWEAFVGAPYDDSDLYLYNLFPSDESWPEGDREVLCLLYEPDVKLTGSMKGSQR